MNIVNLPLFIIIDMKKRKPFNTFIKMFYNGFSVGFFRTGKAGVENRIMIIICWPV